MSTICVLIIGYFSLCFSLADRSFCDIMQYPVMPWLITDYTSDKLGQCMGWVGLIFNIVFFFQSYRLE